MSEDISKLIPQRVTLDVLITKNADTPEEEVVVETVVVRHQRMGDLPQLFKAMAPVMHLIKAIADKKGDGPKVSPTTIVMNHTEDAMQLIATAMHKDITWVRALEITSTIELFTKLLEVNVSFFIQRVLPSALPALASLTAVMQSAGTPDGQRASKASSGVDTAIVSV